jgi:hypothetical protein
MLPFPNPGFCCMLSRKLLIHKIRKVGENSTAVTCFLKDKTFLRKGTK